jgi:RimJ/RimL family protein N-acetyltransferase
MVRGYSQFASARGLRWLRLSIAPGNEASLALARKLGVRMIGSQIDEIDGPEDIYLLDL